MTETTPPAGMELEVRRVPHLTTSRLVNREEWAILAQLANTVYATEFVPSGLRNNKAATLACLLYGREQGLGPMTALGEVSVIDGRPTISAALMAAKIREAGHRLKVDLLYDESVSPPRVVGASAKLWRIDEQFSVEHEFTFDEHDAKAAGLLGKKNWDRYPKAMYQARSLSGIARLAAPDVFIGSAYTTEELAPDVEVDEAGVRQTPVAAAEVVQLPGAGAGGAHLDEVGDAFGDQAVDKPGESGETSEAPAPTDPAAATPGGGAGEDPAAADTATGGAGEGAEREGGAPAKNEETDAALPPFPEKWSGHVYGLGSYDTANVDAISEFLPKMEDDTLLFFRAYEAGEAIDGKGGKKRVTLLRAYDEEIDRRVLERGRVGQEQPPVEPDESIDFGEQEAADQARAAAEADTTGEPEAPEVVEGEVVDEPESEPLRFDPPPAARPVLQKLEAGLKLAEKDDPRWRLASVLAVATSTWAGSMHGGEPYTELAQLSDGQLAAILDRLPEAVLEQVES